MNKASKIVKQLNAQLNISKKHNHLVRLYLHFFGKALS